MSNQEQAFLAAICAAPEDVGLRLIFADWLSENGQADKSEFIRVQIELATTPQYCPCDVCGNNPDETGTIEHGRGCYVVDSDGGGASSADENERCVVLQHRERQLASSSAMWEEDRRIHAAVPIQWPAPIGYSRGFVEHVALSWQDWSTHETAIRAAAPILEVTLTTMPKVEAVHRGPLPIFRLLGGVRGYQVSREEIMAETWEQMQPRVTIALLNAEYGPTIKFNLPS